MKFKLKRLFTTLVVGVTCFTYMPIAYGAPKEPVSTQQLIEMGESMDATQLNSWLIGAGGIYNQRFLQTVNPFDKATTEQAKTARQKSLAGPEWGIKNKEDLESMLTWIISEGHNDEFMDLALMLDSMSDAEYQSLLKEANETGAYMFPLIKDIYKQYGDSGIMAWDLFRGSLLVKWGYEAGYLNMDEVHEWMTPIAVLLKTSFSNWDEACKNYLLGYCYWARLNPAVTGTEYATRVTAYNKIKTEKPEIFNDDLFKK